MKRISKTAARTLEQLVKMAKATGRNYDKIDANGPESGIMPVTVEWVNTYPAQDGRMGYELWSVAHYYTQNGDAMRDPEIVYAIPVDSRGLHFDFAFPQEMTQDGLAGMGRIGAAMSYRRLVEFGRDGQPAKYYPRAQRDAATFTTTWMRNIREQQSPLLKKAA